MISVPSSPVPLPESQIKMAYLDRCPLCANTNISRCITTNAQMHSDTSIFYFDQCQECKLVFLNPRVTPDCLYRYYDKHYLPYRGASAWGRYAGIVLNNQLKLDKVRARLAGKYLDLNKETLILDIGCGQPTFLQTCNTIYRCNTLGIDFSDHGWRDTGDRFSAINLKIAQVKDLDLTVGPDVITMWHYLEHDYDPVFTLSTLRNLAKPDTMLLIEVPNYDSESRKKYGKHWAGYHTPRHTFLFSPQNIKLLLQKTGWQTVHINTSGTLDPYNLYWMSEMEQKGIDWQKDMEPEFWPYVYGMIGFKFKNLFSRHRSLGIMTVIAKIRV